MIVSIGFYTITTAFIYLFLDSHGTCYLPAIIPCHMAQNHVADTKGRAVCAFCTLVIMMRHNAIRRSVYIFLTFKLKIQVHHFSENRNVFLIEFHLLISSENATQISKFCASQILILSPNFYFNWQREILFHLLLLFKSIMLAIFACNLKFLDHQF